MGKVVETHIIGSRIMSQGRLSSSTYTAEDLILLTSPGSGFLFDSWKVTNLLHRVLQAKLVFAKAFGSFAICGELLQIEVGLYTTRSGTARRN